MSVSWDDRYSSLSAMENAGVIGSVEAAAPCMMCLSAAITLGVARVVYSPESEK